MKNLVGDTLQFAKLNKDPTTTCQNKNNSLVAELLKDGLIDEKQSHSLRTYTANAPRMFGQIKFHKEGNPIRPIVSTVNTPAYKLSRYLATILK